MTSEARGDVGSLRLLAISGSLRARSSNTSLLRLAMDVAPDDVRIAMYGGLASLPHFNPDDDVDSPPAPVLDLRARVGDADGLLLCSPEYAHGVPGALKNALDWLVASVELPHKPVALLNASPWAIHAQASLIETLTVMTARIVPEACATIPVTRAELTADGTIESAEIRSALRAALDAFARDIRSYAARAS
ncbi:MAG TPA: NADPH-dependent FMN reductase [Gemmatimonadaceae bacterium]|nr:NADPH-dependent FMN reductase [Gemmatimonadaceae bacterium]